MWKGWTWIMAGAFFTGLVFGANPEYPRAYELYLGAFHRFSIGSQNLTFDAGHLLAVGHDGEHGHKSH